MDYLQFINQVKMSSDEEVKSISESYGIDFSLSEIRALRPLLDEISFHWLFTGIPDSFMLKVQQAIGREKTEQLFHMYLDATQ